MERSPRDLAILALGVAGLWIKSCGIVVGNYWLAAAGLAVLLFSISYFIQRGDQGS